MIQKISYLAAFVITILVVVACQPHDAFCFGHPHGAKVRINVDWSEFKEEKPTGMSLLIYSTTDSVLYTQYTTETIDHAEFNLLPEGYTVLVHNQGTLEFATIAFSDMVNLSTARVFPERRTSEWYKPSEGEILASAPEWLAFDKKDFLATEGTINEESANEEHSHEQEESLFVSTLTPRNIIYTLHLTIDVRGINNYRAGRAAITGMADGYFPGTGEYGSQQVTHLIEDWKVEKRYSHTDGVQEGVITAQIGCFGLPVGHDSKPSTNKLRLSLLLADNKTVINHIFNVGDKFYRQAADANSLHLYLELQLPDKLPDVTPAQGDTGQSGFDAEVNDWGEEENTEVIM